ncbi:MAG: hypothetical protein JW854_09200 [Actinobacteria bacterium]|nr:hypothetical protein [Actinomycetota bacterium]
MVREDNAEVRGKRSARKMLPLAFVAIAILLAFQLTQLDESRKRFIMHLLKQAPYLPGRYYA